MKNPAEQLFNEGMREHANFVATFHRARVHAFNAGLFFIQSRAAFKNGDWGDYIATFNAQLGRSGVYFYMQLASELLESARAQKVPERQLEESARNAVLQSPLALTALCRELKFIRRLGDYDSQKYDPVKHAIQKMRGQQEFTFAYETCVEQLDALLASARVNELKPSSLAALKSKLEQAQACVEEAIQQTRAIEV